MSINKWMFLAFLWLLPTIQGAAQNVDTAWVRIYDGPDGGPDAAVAIAVDQSGYVYVAGSSSGSGRISSDDYAVVKYGPDGSTAWVRRYDGPGNYMDQLRGMTIDNLGNVYVTGVSDGVGTYGDYATIKYYANGDTAWVRRFDGAHQRDEARAIAVDSSGNVYVTGSVVYFVSQSEDYGTIKYDANGTQLWFRLFGGPEPRTDRAYDLALDDSGNVYVAGDWNPNPEFGNYSTVKYRPNGDSVWVSVYEGPGEIDFPVAVTVDASSNVYVTGVSYGLDVQADIATVKLYPNGDTAWVRRYDGPAHQDDNARAIALDQAGNIYVTGQAAVTTGLNTDFVTVKYYPNGDTAWVRRYDGGGDSNNSFDGATAIALDSMGNIYVTGSIRGGNQNASDIATVKYNPAGELLWAASFSSPGSREDAASAIAVDEQGCVCVTGYVNAGFPYLTDYCTLKYVQYDCGDADHSGVVDISDAVYLIAYIFAGGPAPLPMLSGDANCDYIVDIADAVYLIAYIFAGGPAPCAGCP